MLHLQDENDLILHQKNKHFKCTECGKRLGNIKALTVHSLQVHKITVTAVPDALSNRQDPSWEIVGMAGVPLGMKPGDETPKPGQRTMVHEGMTPNVAVTGPSHSTALQQQPRPIYTAALPRGVQMPLPYGMRPPPPPQQCPRSGTPVSTPVRAPYVPLGYHPYGAPYMGPQGPGSHGQGPHMPRPHGPGPFPVVRPPMQYSAAPMPVQQRPPIPGLGAPSQSGAPQIIRGVSRVPVYTMQTTGAKPPTDAPNGPPSAGQVLEDKSSIVARESSQISRPATKTDQLFEEKESTMHSALDMTPVKKNGLVWSNEEESMEENRASASKYRNSFT